MKTKELVRILNLLMVAVERKAVVAQYDHFVFYDGAVSTFNGKIFISHPIEIDLECSVVAEDLLNILKTVDDEEVTLTLNGNILTVKSSDVNAELSTEVYEDNVVRAIRTMDVGGLDWDGAPSVSKDFIEAISNCRFSVNKDVSCSLNTNCLHVIDNVMESTDGFRCTEYMMDGDMEELLIPVSSAISLTAFDPTHYVPVNGWCHFIDEDNVIFSVATVSGTFPDLDKVFRSSKPDVQLKLPMQITSILSEFGKLSAGESDIFKFMEISIKEDEVICKTEKQGCVVKKKIAFPGKRAPVTFFISPVLLHSVMSKTDTIGINYTTNIASFSSENFNHIITLPQSEQKETEAEDVPF